MQLPGMSTQPVRVTLEVTFFPHDGTWGIARRSFRQDENHTWQMEEMATSGTPLTLSECSTRLEQACWALQADMRTADDPFADIGAFR